MTALNTAATGYTMSNTLAVGLAGEIVEEVIFVTYYIVRHHVIALTVMNYVINHLLPYTTRALTDINDLGKVGCPRTVSGCALDRNSGNRLSRGH